MFAAAYGFGALIAIVIIRRLGFGPWGIAAIAVPAIGLAVSVNSERAWTAHERYRACLRGALVPGSDLSQPAPSRRHRLDRYRRRNLCGNHADLSRH